MSNTDKALYQKLVQFWESMELDRGKLPSLDYWLNYLTVYNTALEDLEEIEKND